MENNNLRIAILASGSGSNLESILKHCQSGIVPANPVAVLSNNPSSYALNRAQQYEIPALISNHREFKTRGEHEKNIIEQLKPFNPQLIVLAGYMRVVTSVLINEFHGRYRKNLPGVMNIHPADTTQYQGSHGYEYALGLLPKLPNRLKETKITVHFVDEGVDTGPIIAQVPVLIEPKDDLKQLRKRGLSIEHEIYPWCIRLYAVKSLHLKDGKVYIQRRRIRPGGHNIRC